MCLLFFSFLSLLGWVGSGERGVLGGEGSHAWGQRAECTAEYISGGDTKTEHGKETFTANWTTSRPPHMKPCVACEYARHGLFFSLFDFFLFFFTFTTGYCVTLYKDIWRRPSVRSWVVSGCLRLEDLDVIPEQLHSSQRGCRLAAVQTAWQGEHVANTWLCLPQCLLSNRRRLVAKKGDVSFCCRLWHCIKERIWCCVELSIPTRRWW